MAVSGVPVLGGRRMAGMDRTFSLCKLFNGVSLSCVAAVLLRGVIYEPEPVNGLYLVALAAGAVTIIGYQFPPSGDPIC